MNFFEQIINLLGGIKYHLAQIESELHMANVNQQQFDADLTAFLTNVTALITAIQAFLALPPVADLSAEDAEVQAAGTAVTAAIAGIPQPPVPPTPGP
jgi:hypothetical protein